MNLCLEGDKVDLASFGGDPLLTAVLLSLFCDAKAEDEELEAGESKKGGFWGDLLDERAEPLGSKLWTLKRAVRGPETLERAEAYAKEALAWMLAQGLTRELSVEARFEGETLRLFVQIDGRLLKLSEGALC